MKVEEFEALDAEEYARKWRTIHILRKDYPRVKYLAALKEMEIGDLFSEMIDNELDRLGSKLSQT